MYSGEDEELEIGKSNLLNKKFMGNSKPEIR